MTTIRVESLDDEAVDERTLADELIDDLLPPEFDWRRT